MKPAGWQTLSIVLLMLHFVVSCNRDAEEDVLREVAAVQPDPALSPEVLFENLAYTLREKRTDLVEGLLSPDFIFIDETLSIPIQWAKEREVFLVKKLLRRNRGIDFALTVLSREVPADGCDVISGIVSMTVTTVAWDSIRARDETRLTVCPGVENGLWRLREWRTTSKIPPEPGEEGLEFLSWGEMKLSVEEPPAE